MKKEKLELIAASLIAKLYSGGMDRNEEIITAQALVSVLIKLEKKEKKE